jgi:predicted alpha/beta superfamily hydrolase
MKNYYIKGCLFLFVLAGIVSPASAQFTLRLRLIAQPALHLSDTVFAAGNFNNWQPGKNEYRFSKTTTGIELQIKDLPAGIYEFKCTRGSWQKTETLIDGSDTDNHLVKLIADTVIDIAVAAWKDDFAAILKKHTASPNVKILDTAFEMPQLRTKRRLWIYLPPDYKTSDKKYPVLYMHDGENIFDEYTAAFGEWGVDECIDSLIKKGTPACIVIGIDNGPERMQEYNPYEYKEFGKGKGDQYIDFLIKTLKPFIDQYYRTLPSAENTLIAGSSMGGLISYYAMLKHSDVFGKAGIFSPAFQTAAQIKTLTNSVAGKLHGKLFFYMGGLEGESYLNNMNEVVETIGRKSDAMIYNVVDPEGSHNEHAWKKWFPVFYKWIMADGFNSVIELEK